MCNRSTELLNKFSLQMLNICLYLLNSPATLYIAKPMGWSLPTGYGWVYEVYVAAFLFTSTITLLVGTRWLFWPQPCFKTNILNKYIFNNIIVYTAESFSHETHIDDNM